MTYRSRKYTIILILLFVLSGCEKLVRYNAPEYNQKLVVNSFLSPSDSVYNVSVTSNQPVYMIVDHEEVPGIISGTISDGTNEVPLVKKGPGYHFWPEDMPLIPGTTYTLKLSSENGLNVEASSTIPEVKDFMMKIDTLSVTHEGYYDSWKEFRVNTEFTDDPEEINYYSIIGSFMGYKTNEKLEVHSFKEKLWFEESYLKDNRKDAENRIKRSAWLMRSSAYYDSAFVTVYLLNTEESYYLYHKSLEKYGQGDNPFSEASPVYSNIEGGLGIFTSYTMDSLRFRLK
jgi:hypothetical protein